MRLRNLAVLCTFSLLSFVSAKAQDYLYATGTPVYGTSLPIDHGVVNVNNGDIHLEFPLATKQQRGALALNEKLIYDSRIWRIVNDGSSMWQPTNIPNSSGGWRFSSGLGIYNAAYESYQGTDYNVPGCDSSSPQNYTQYSRWSWIDPSGTQHSFPSVSTTQYIGGGAQCPTPAPGVPNSTGSASDGSGYTLSVTNYQIPTIIDSKGVTYHLDLCPFQCQSQTNVVTDRNGNSWSTDANSNLIDTSGSAPVLVTLNGYQTFYDVLVTGGSRQRYTVTGEAVPFSTAFDQPGVFEVSGSLSSIQSIALPDGSSYTFTYDSYGELHSMTLPTGGTVTYNYSNYMDPFSNENRWVSSIVRDGGTTSFTPATVSNCSSSSTCQETVTVTNPDKNDTVYTFNLDQAGTIAGGSFTDGTKTYKGPASNNLSLRNTTTKYTYTPYSTKTDENGTYVVTGSYQVPASVTNTVTLPDAGVTTQTSTTYNIDGYLPSEVKVWNFGNAASNPPDTDTTYKYVGSFPQSIVTKDASNNQIASTTYGYDESTPTASSGVPSHTSSVSTPRNNVTSQHRWINSTGTTLDTVMTYDDAGALLTSTLPEGKTTYSYDPTDTFVTGTTAPTPSSGAVLTAGAMYDASTGALTSTTDPNGKSVQYKAFDIFNRPGEIDSPDGGVTKVTYSSPTMVNVSTAFNSAGNGTIMKLYDAYGRPSRTAVATGQGSTFYQKDICYDVTGRIHFQSYRYQGPGFSATAVCSGAGDTYSYDALGRTTKILHGDGTNLNYTYTGRAIKTTDENGVSKVSQSDAFGRIITACELTSTTTAASETPASCNTDIPGTGFATTYTYNPAAFQTTVNQGAQMRTFTTDSLGRQVSVQEPESGTTAYSYAYNSTGLLVTRTKPRANQTNPAVTTTTMTQYDALDRPVSVTYNDGTGSKRYSYDIAVPNTNSVNVLGRLAQQAAATSSVGPAVEAFSYDASGRTTQVVTCTPSTCGKSTVTQNYVYDFAGNMTGSTDGAGASLIYGYTPANENAGVAALAGSYPASVVTNVVNGPNGPTSYQLGNGLNQVYRYNALGQRDGGWVCSGSSSQFCTGGTQLYGFSVTYTGRRVNQACDTVLNNCSTVGYDDFNRLQSRTTTSGTTLDGSWGYDRYGNRRTQTVAPSGYQQQLSVNTANNQVLGFAYDAAGNLLQDAAHSYTYDAEGNMTAVDAGTAKYFYNASNRRVRTDLSSASYELLFNLTGQKVAIWNVSNGSVVEEDTHLGVRPLAVYLNSSLSFEHQDWLGTERLLTGGDGSVLGNYTSYPYGDGFTDNGDDLDPYHFSGMDHDYESMLDHATFREYSNTGGRWVSPDPYRGSYNFSNPQTLNRYSYALNDPLSKTDPSGEDDGEDGCGDNGGGNSGGEYGGGGGDNGGDPSGITVPCAMADSCVMGTPPPSPMPIPTPCDGPDCYGNTGPTAPGPTSGGSSSGSSGGSIGGSSSALEAGMIVPSSMHSDAEYRCINTLFITSAIAGVGSALGVQAPGSDTAGDVDDALKNAAHNPVIIMSASAMAARLGSTLLTSAGALALGEAISTKFVPIVGAAATLYGIYSAVSDGIDYFNDNEAACHDAE